MFTRERSLSYKTKYQPIPPLKLYTFTYKLNNKGSVHISYIKYMLVNIKGLSLHCFIDNECLSPMFVFTRTMKGMSDFTTYQ